MIHHRLTLAGLLGILLFLGLGLQRASASAAAPGWAVSDFATGFPNCGVPACFGPMGVAFSDSFKT
jgi:hypothetical protein